MGELFQALRRQPGGHAHQDAGDEADEHRPGTAVVRAVDGDQRRKDEGQGAGGHGIFQDAGQAEHTAQDGALFGAQQNGADDHGHVDQGGFDDGQVDVAQGRVVHQEDDGGK